jgi:hypothetical protein
MNRLSQVLWARVWTPGLWAAGVGFGLVSGYATLMLSPLLGIPLAVLWVLLLLRRTLLVGVAGAPVGLGIEWLWLVANAGPICNLMLPPSSACTWSLAVGPSWSADPSAWNTLSNTLAAVALVTVAAGVALTVRLAWRLRERQLL